MNKKQRVFCRSAENSRSLERKGFSLIEVIVTVLIIAVLSMISGPIYRSYSDKAILTEGYALLGTIRAAQENYYNDTGIFLCGDDTSTGRENIATCNEEILGIDVRHNKYYTAFMCGRRLYPLNNSASSSYKQGFCAIALGPQSLTMFYILTSGVTMY